MTMRPVAANPHRFISRVMATAILALVGCGPAQYILDPTLNNVACTAIAMLVSILTLVYTMRTQQFRRAPMSSIMLLGLNVSSFSGALVVQTISGRALIYNLDSALDSFAALALTHAVVIATHWLYIQSQTLQRLRRVLTRRVAVPLGFFAAPTKPQLWIFGLIGCAATMLAARNYTDAVAFGDVSGKLALAYGPFVVAPFFVPMRAYLFGEEPERGARNWIVLAAYSLLLITVAIANNARATFSQGFLTLALCLLIAVLSGRLVMTRRRVLVGVLLAAACVPFFSTLSDLATAMVIARDQRLNTSPTELIGVTLENFQNKALIDQRRQLDALILGDEYNENYVANPIFARFIYTKFVDVNMTNALTLSETQAAALRRNTGDRILAMLPTPLLVYFRLNIDKTDLGYSSGDIYSFIARGLDLGRYTTGSEVPDGMIILGPFFWVFLAAMALIQFLIYDAFSYINRQGRFVIAAVVLINLVPIFTLGIMQESVSNQVGAILRGIPQLLFLYWILELASGLLTRPGPTLAQFHRKLFSKAVGPSRTSSGRDNLEHG